MRPGLSDNGGLGCQLVPPASGSHPLVLLGWQPDAESLPPGQPRPLLPGVRNTIRIISKLFNDS